MVNLRNLSVILALRIEGAKFSGILDKDVNYLSGKFVQNMNKHGDVYFEVVKFLVDKVMHGKHQDFWNFLPDFLIIDICKLVFPDDMLKDVQETIIEVEQQYYQDQQTGKLTEDVNLDISNAFENSDNNLENLVRCMDILSVQKIYPDIALASSEQSDEAMLLDHKIALLDIIKDEIWGTYRGQLWIKKAFGDGNIDNIKQMYGMSKRHTFGSDRQKDEIAALLSPGDQIKRERAARIDNIRNIFLTLDSETKKSKGWGEVKNKKIILNKLAKERNSKIEYGEFLAESKEEGRNVEIPDDYNPDDQIIVLDIIDEIMLGGGEFAGMYFHFKKLNVAKNLLAVKDGPKNWQSNSKWIRSINKGRVSRGLTEFGLLFRSRAMIYAHVLSNLNNKPGNIPKAYKLVYKEISKHNSENESQGITYGKFQSFDFTNPENQLSEDAIRAKLMLELEVELGQPVLEE